MKEFIMCHGVNCTKRDSCLRAQAIPHNNIPYLNQCNRYFDIDNCEYYHKIDDETVHILQTAKKILSEQKRIYE